MVVFVVLFSRDFQFAVALAAFVGLIVVLYGASAFRDWFRRRRS